MAILVVVMTMTNATYAQSADMNWLKRIHQNRNTGLDGTMNAISKTTYPISFALPATELLYGLIIKDEQALYNSVQSLGGLAINTVIVYGLKYTMQRERPYKADATIIPYHYDDSPSFPSGHTSFAFSTAASLSIKYPRWYIIAPAAVWAGTVGYSRLHLGEHYPTDVAAGALIGAGSSVISYYGTKWLQQQLKKKKDKQGDHL